MQVAVNEQKYVGCVYPTITLDWYTLAVTRGSTTVHGQ